MLHILALALLIPFFCASLVSSGTMPSIDGQGRLTVTLCGAGPGVTLAPDGGGVSPAGDQSQDKAAQPCIWSLHAQPLALASAPVLPELSQSGERVARDAGRAPAIVARDLPPQARGPPILS